MGGAGSRLAALLLTGGLLAAGLPDGPAAAKGHGALPDAEPAPLPVVRLTSLDWPPFTIDAKQHPGSRPGLDEIIARAAFAAVGYRLETDFYPWQRAMALSRSDPRYLGYYPRYSPYAGKDCLLSDSLGESPLGLAERADAHLRGQSLDQLSHTTIGVVAGYLNTPEFDARVRQGRLKTETVTNDATNLRKLIYHRLTAAVIDRNVMTYLLDTTPDLAAHRDELVFDPHDFPPKALHVCFRPTEQGAALMTLFNQGLRRIDIAALTAAYFRAGHGAEKSTETQ